MDRLHTIEIFIRVAQTLSFSRTAEQLQLPRSTVSAAVQTLESHLQTRLLHRTTRKIQLTIDGSLYLDWAQRLLADIADTEQRLRQGSAVPAGKLRISVPGRIASYIIAPHLPDFLRQYPDIELEISSTDRPVDLIDEGIDCAIRVGEMHNDNLIAKTLGQLSQGTFASPAYLTECGVPQRPDDLAQHRVVNYLSPVTGRVLAPEFQLQGKIYTPPFAAKIAVNSVESYIACCCAGLGLIQIPQYDAQQLLQEGKLVEVLSDYAPPSMIIAAVYPDRRYVSRRVRVFIDWMQQLFRHNMQPI
ncbi:LysR family transcriptional regulator [Rheinheimera muenzenbergensis]|uniref:LysR family transcriptional regulator n=1 Tax=Rheinheimera muenzenbergensis TaxID=1193628 RepID=A0ABU8C6S0_9GAMM